MINVFRATIKNMEKKLFSFGMIADVQYANVDNKLNYRQTQMRYYRQSIMHLEQAVAEWNSSDISFVVQLGDIIDGISKRNNESEKDFSSLVKVIDKYKSTGLNVIKDGSQYKFVNNQGHYSPYICHVWGNHEFYNFSREFLYESKLNSIIRSVKGSEFAAIPSNCDYYFSFCFHNFRMVVLDTYDVSICGRNSESQEYKTAVELLNKYNENSSKLEPHSSNPRYVSWNGAVGERQLSWLRNELCEAENLGQKVIVLSHIPLHPNATKQSTLCWNYDTVISVLASHSCVVACFAGHLHNGGFFHDRATNIRYMTFPGVIERHANENSYAIIDVFKDRLKINGCGLIENAVFDFS